MDLFRAPLPNGPGAGRARDAHTGRYHVQSELNRGTASCSASMPLGSIGPAGDVPRARRCQRQGCRQLWELVDAASAAEASERSVGGAPPAAEDVGANAPAERSSDALGSPDGSARCAREYLPLESIRMDGGTQQRSELRPDVVEEYTEAYRSGAALPPVTVFSDGDGEVWLADGFHRLAAAAQAELAELECEIREGTRRDAVLWSVGANAHHGLRRSRADARRAIETLLRDAEWGARSDRWIAERCHVSHRTVAAVREELARAGQVDKLSTRVGADGKTYQAQTPAPRRSSTATTVVYDGDPVPDDVWEPDAPDPRQVRMFEEEEAARVAEDLGDASSPPASATDRSAIPQRAFGRLPPETGAGFDESGPVSLTPRSDRSESWRDTLGLAGPVGPLEILAAAERAQQGADEARRAAVARAVSVGLSQWNTHEREARLVAELALAGLRRPTARRPVRILEPSAGTGALVRGLVGAGITSHHQITAVEVDPGRAAALRGDRAIDRIVCGDFLQVPRSELGPLDVVVMNPPYEGGLDARHVARAMELAPRVVALLRLNALAGQGRYDLVWRSVAEAAGPLGPWVLSEAVILTSRPEFDGPGDHGARGDYVIVRMDRVRAQQPDPLTIVRWA